MPHGLVPDQERPPPEGLGQAVSAGRAIQMRLHLAVYLMRFGMFLIRLSAATIRHEAKIDVTLVPRGFTAMMEGFKLPPSANIVDLAEVRRDSLH